MLLTALADLRRQWQRDRPRPPRGGPGQAARLSPAGLAAPVAGVGEGRRALGGLVGGWSQRRSVQSRHPQAMPCRAGFRAPTSIPSLSANHPGRLGRI